MDHDAVRPTVIDLYAGAGGMSLGMEQAGFDVLSGVEFDAVHAAVHKYNFPLSDILCADLSATSASDLLASAARGWSLHHPSVPFPGHVDVVVGGPPCQGFSVGGVREADDARNNQLLRFVRLVAQLRPRAFCLENVAGLLERTFDRVRELALAELLAAGYAVTGFDAPVNAKDFGVPQSRRRVLVMGVLGSEPAQPLAGLGSMVTVGDALRGLPDLVRYRRLLHDDEAQWKPGHRVVDLAVLGTYSATLSGLVRDPEDHSYRRVFDDSLITSSRRTVHTAKTVLRFARTAPGTSEKVSRLFRLDEGQVARTIRAGTGSDRGSHTSPRPIHPTKNRVITVREAARLHGYPDWFRFHTTNWHGHREVGNSVPPPLARAAGRALLDALGMAVCTPSKPVALEDAWLLRLNATTAARHFASIRIDCPA